MTGLAYAASPAALNQRRALSPGLTPSIWLLACAAALLTLIVTLPANWLAYWVAQRSAGRVVLADASGSVWHGSAVLSFASVALADAPSFSLPGRLEWHWQWPTNFSLPLQLRHESVLAQPLQLHFGWRGLQIAAGAAALPLALSTLAGAPLNTLRLQGQARLEWSALNLSYANGFNHGVNAASGNIQFDDVSAGINAAIASVRPLGAYRLEWAQTQSGLQWRLRTTSGPLQLQADGDQAHFNGTAAIAPNTSPAITQRLQPLLNVLGRRDAVTNQVNIQTGSL